MEVIAIGIGLVALFWALFGNRQRSSKREALDFSDDLFDVDTDLDL